LTTRQRYGAKTGSTPKVANLELEKKKDKGKRRISSEVAKLNGHGEPCRTKHPVDEARRGFGSVIHEVD